MDEKEFLIKFIKTFAPKEEEHNSGSDEYLSAYVNDFLIEHHKNYKQVYWYKVGVSEREQVKEQVKIKLREFLEFLPITLDSNYQDIIIDAYLKEKNYYD